MKTRAAAANILHQVLNQGQSLSTLLPRYQQEVAAKDRALLQELCFGTLRWYSRLDAIAKQLLEKPLKGKYQSVHSLLLVGIYQLLYTRIPAHAALAETVNACKLLKAEPFKGMVNGVLRNVQRQQDELTAKVDALPQLRLAHPNWLVKRLQKAYPEQWQDILEANNQHPPMWIRVNQSHHSREDYLALLQQSGQEAEPDNLAEGALRLARPADVTTLPGFELGHSSVQDAAAQMAAQLLEAAPGETVLDACAAPGGKTAHILERQPALAQLVAVDMDGERLKRVYQNLERIGLQATVIQGDAAKPADWWQGPAFDRILLDAPCSATGVIRRHPDIKWLRRPDDIAQLAALQAQILDALWQQLKPGGTLLYATCSILPDENSAQIKAFLQRTPDARHLPLHPSDTVEQPGWQLLPGAEQRDGFYYAKLSKLP
ncbi:16S rRNA (cytosine(967)-C(5))-methyltransferase RsmB [Oceanisphaera arctica]|uniref:Ribosomal RNA small subunit methyltransferase B n=1 Tax=Oceanisphaera arctica TaxID=641510 RepID=A0A2P5TNN5_9GAMM|nr:16S rRNA (cytosine(967)-C(5))-methyltransferase RsmB [Oceanisphaera arctica]PPL17223.1 16S rRNA (cytosine(967)-C(5))-methyltransferase [Oceanisphaera arctica]GHA20469.1 ribosomal RNA small subunit methyltransferase B [Oceanisphaera arctica]